MNSASAVKADITDSMTEVGAFSSLGDERLGEAVPVGKLLQLVGRELRDLAVRVDDMHVLVGGNKPGQSAAEPGYVEAAQSIDVVSQHLAAIADFFGVLELTMPAHWAVDTAPAARVVTLSALAARLGCPEAARAIADPAAGNDLELF